MFPVEFGASWTCVVFEVCHSKGFVSESKMLFVLVDNVSSSPFLLFSSKRLRQTVTHPWNVTERTCDLHPRWIFTHIYLHICKNISTSIPECGNTGVLCETLNWTSLILIKDRLNLIFSIPELWVKSLSFLVSFFSGDRTSHLDEQWKVSRTENFQINRTTFLGDFPAWMTEQAVSLSNNKPKISAIGENIILYIINNFF